MHADEIRRLLHATPFRPFRVFLPSDRAFTVPHQDFALLTPNGRTLVVAQNEQEPVDLLDVALIARVEVQDSNSS